MTMPEQKSSEERKELSPEEFLNQLYDQSLAYIKTLGGEVISEFGSQEIRRHDQSPIDLQKGVLIQIWDRPFALALDRRTGRGPSRGQPELGVMFGFQRDYFRNPQATFEFIINPPPIHGASFATGAIHYGEYANDDRVQVACWTDQELLGGEDLFRLPPQDLLSPDGLEKSLRVVKRFVRAYEPVD